MFTLPEKIFESKFDTPHTVTGGVEFHNQINRALTQQNVTLSMHNYAKYDNVSTDNPFLKLIFLLLIYKNSPNALAMHIIEESAVLTEGQQIELIRDTDTEPLTLNIAIRRIVKGAAYLKDQPFDDIELKTYSLGLQRSSQHKIRVVKPSNSTVIIYTNVWNYELAYKIMALIPKFFPIYYNMPERAAIDVIKAIYNLNTATFVRTIHFWEDTTKFHQQTNKTLLAQWVKTTYQNTLNNLQRELNQVKDSIRRNENELEIHYQTVQMYLEKKHALEAQNDSDNSENINEIQNYLDNNKSLIYYGWENDKLNLQIKSTLEYIDVEAAKKVISRWDPTFSVTLILKALLFNPKFENYHLIVFGEVHLTLSPPKVAAVSRNIAANCLPSPHLFYYNCWGNNKNIILNALAKGDIILAIEQVIAATKHLNILDSTVVNSFIDYIRTHYTNNSGAKFIINTETDETYTCREFLNIINKEEQNETN